MICHGQGDLTLPLPGCCYLPGGTVCPQRWRIDYTGLDPTTQTRQAHIFDSSGTDLGTVDAFVKQVHSGKPRQDRVVDVIQGAVFVCGALANAVIANGIPTGANWASEFDAAWSAVYEPGGAAAVVGDAWAAVGKPRNWCVSFGPAEGHCCFGEDQATNDAKAAALTTTRVSIASRSTLGG